MRLSSVVSSAPSSSSRAPRRTRVASCVALMLVVGCGETDSGGTPVNPTTSTTPSVTPTPVPGNPPVTPPSGNPTTPPVTPPVAPPTTGTPPVTPPVTPPQNPPVNPTIPPPVNPTTPPDTTSTPPVTTDTGGDSSEQPTSDTGEPPTPVGPCPANPGTAPSGNSTATHVASVTQAENDYDFHLYEGPVWLDGALYFSDVKPSPWDSNIRKYVPGVDGTTDFLVAAGSNGLAVDANGVLHSATARKKEISKYDLATKEQTTAVPGPFNSPNDIAIASDGTIYFSDQQQGELPAGGKPQVVHFVKGGQDDIFSEDIQPPNGVLLSPEEDILYVTVTGNGVIKKATIGADGKAETVTDFATGLQTPDGMTKDCLGNIYVAEHNAQQVTVFTPDGTKIATIKTGTANNQNANPTNVAFGGADGKTLFITASYSLWQAEMPVAGYPY